MAITVTTSDTTNIPDEIVLTAVPSNPNVDGPQAASPSTDPAPVLFHSRLSWQSLKSSVSISEKTSAHLGWGIALLSVLFTVVTLSPAFKSQDMAARALELAEWTALKDYIEECREELAAGVQSPACSRAVEAKIPPPPYVKPGALDKVTRRLVQVQVECNGAANGSKFTQRELGASAMVQAVVFLSFLLIACVFLFLSFETSRSRIRCRSHSHGCPESDEPRLSSHGTAHEMNITTSTIRRPPSPSDTSLRRRTIRSHPIYRHGNLEEAIHHSDMSEIRLRLENGEDVNQHWPYIIYKLAITPPTVETPKRLEVARLCLDFGADVNALKGWNGQSALMIAIGFGNVAVAKILIANGATVGYSPPDSNLTALHRCVRLAVTGVAEDALEIMNMLFDYGANANQVDRVGETALHKLVVDAWMRRESAMSLEALVPVAMCLIEHGALLPRGLNEKYIKENRIWNVVCVAIRKRDWSRI